MARSNFVFAKDVETRMVVEYNLESNLPWRSVGEHAGLRYPRSFAPLFDINRQTLDLLMEAATTSLSDQTWLSWRKLGVELARLDTTQLESLARCPFSLIDVGIRDAPYSPRSDRMPDEPRQGLLMFSDVLLQNRIDQLAHAVFVFAWHLVRSDLIAARLVLGIDAVSTSALTQITLTDIQRIAREQVRNRRVHPLWHTRPEIWFRLIHTARFAHGDTFASVSTRGLQLFLQELLTDRHDA